MANLPYISEDILSDYHRSLKPSSSEATTKRKQASLKKFFNWAHEKGYAEVNPIKVAPPSISESRISQREEPLIVKPRKNLNISKIIKVSLGIGMMICAVALVKILKLPIPFIFAPASENTLITITDPSITPIASIAPSPIQSPSPIGSFSPIPIPVNSPIPVTQQTAGQGGIDFSSIESDSITISTTTASDGNITLNPDGAGKFNIILEGSKGPLVKATAANLNSGSLYYGYVGNNSTSYDLLLLQSGSSPTTKFSVDASGNTYIKGNIDNVKDINLTGNLKFNGATYLTSLGRLTNLSGYSQASGLFEIDQGAPDYATIEKILTNSTGKATREVLKVELDESQVADGSSEDALIVSRKNSKSDGYAIYVPNGNVQFDNNLGIGGDLHINRNVSANGQAGFGSITLSHNDVSHGLTSFGNTSAFLLLSTISTTEGGSQLTAISDSDAQALSIRGIMGSTNPTDATPAVKIVGAKSNGVTGSADLASAETVFQIQNNDNAASFTVQGDGDVVIIGSGTTCTIGDGTGTTSCTSDARLKENVQNLDIGLGEILALRPVNYNWIDKSRPQDKNIGLIAQEVQGIIPQAVTEVYDGYLGIDYGSLVVPLIRSVQELNAKIEEGGNFVGENIEAGGVIASKIVVNGTLTASNIVSENVVAGAITVDQFVSDSVVAQSGKFLNFIAENITAGAIETKKFTTDSAIAFTASIDNLLVKTGLVSPSIKTALISPLGDETNVIIQVGNGDELGKLAITNAKQEEIASIDSEGTATFSGTVFANKVVANSVEDKEGRAKIEALLSEIEENKKLLREAEGWKTEIAAGSAKLDEVASSRLFVTDQAAINSLAIATTINVGNELILALDGINTITKPLTIQALGLAPIELMAGKIRINTSGDVEVLGNMAIGGNLDVAGKTRFGTLQTNRLVIASQGETSRGETSQNVIETNATAGIASIATETSEITIKNPNITDTTLVYVTPTSPTNNQVLFVKSKELGSFVAGFLDPIEAEVSFNWWVIEVQ